MAARTEIQSPSDPVVEEKLAPIIRPNPPYLLLADDDRAEAKALAEMLGKQNIACDVVHSEGDVICAFLARDYDMVLMNFRGPLQAGLDASMSIRKLERSIPEPRAPILILTTAATEKERSFAKNAGVDDILERRTDVAALVAIVEHSFEVERRTPPDLILREPLQFARLLKDSRGDEEAAEQRGHDFSRILADSIEAVRSAIAAGNIQAVHAAGSDIRRISMDFGSERTRRIGTLMSRIATIGQLADRGAELLRELVDTARDLHTWLALKLGRIVFQDQETTGSRKISISKPSDVKTFSLLNNREDAFSKV